MFLQGSGTAGSIHHGHIDENTNELMNYNGEPLEIEEIKETWGAFNRTCLRRLIAGASFVSEIFTKLSLTGLTRSFSFVLPAPDRAVLMHKRKIEKDPSAT